MTSTSANLLLNSDFMWFKKVLLKKNLFVHMIKLPNCMAETGFYSMNYRKEVSLDRTAYWSMDA